MNPRSPAGRLIVFILVIMIMNGILWLLNVPIRFSIIGSIVASLLFSGIMELLYRRR